MNVQKKDIIFSLQKRLASGVLAEIFGNFKGCTVQSTIRNSAHSDSNEQVDKIKISEEQVDAKNWLKNDYTEHVYQINDSDKQVGAISDSEILVVTGSDPKSDPSNDPEVATHTTNIKSTHRSIP